MLLDHFPLLGLRITTPRLELRLPAGEELSRLDAAGWCPTVPVTLDGLEPCLPLLGAVPASPAEEVTPSAPGTGGG